MLISNASSDYQMLGYILKREGREVKQGKKIVRQLLKPIGHLLLILHDWYISLRYIFENIKYSIYNNHSEFLMNNILRIIISTTAP